MSFDYYLNLNILNYYVELQLSDLNWLNALNTGMQISLVYFQNVLVVISYAHKLMVNYTFKTNTMLIKIKILIYICL